MIATRREFMKFSAAAAAGLVLRPVADPSRPDRDLCDSRQCPLEKDGKHWQQVLRPGDSILGPVAIYSWDVRSKGDYRTSITASLMRGKTVLMSAAVQGFRYTWVGHPGAELFIPHGTEVVFLCSSNSGESTVMFEKLS